MRVCMYVRDVHVRVRVACAECGTNETQVNDWNNDYDAVHVGVMIVIDVWMLFEACVSTKTACKQRRLQHVKSLLLL